MAATPMRIVHCGTGLAGKEGLRAILLRDDLELVGLYTHSAVNCGRDAGSFVDLPPCGVLGTDDFAALRALGADAMIYMGRRPDLDILCGFLADGTDVLTTAGFPFPTWNDPEAAARLQAAGERGGSSFYVSGVNPGFVDEVLPLTMSALSVDWETIHIAEFANCAAYPNQGTLQMMGFGHPPEDFENGTVPEMATMVGFFEAATAGLAHGFGLDLDEVRTTRDLVTTPTAIEIQVGTIPAGTVAGQRWRWAGIKDGVERIVQTTYWIVAFDLGEGWPGGSNRFSDVRWEITIEGRPSMRCTFETRETFMPDVDEPGMFNPSGVATAMALVNRLHAVRAARPGIVTAGDLAQARRKG